MSLKSHFFCFLVGVVAWSGYESRWLKKLWRSSSSALYLNPSTSSNADNAQFNSNRSDIFASKLANQINKPTVETFALSPGKGFVHIGIDFCLANSIVVETAAGDLVVVDTTENPECLRKIWSQIPFHLPPDQLRLKTIIITHHHGDHNLGIPFLFDWARNRGQEPSRDVDIVAHSTYVANNDRVSMTQASTFSRATAQFGNKLPEKFKLGFSGKLNLENNYFSFYEPTVVFDDKLDLEVGGVRFDLYHVPGETDDQINIYLPEENVYMLGDNFYPMFPNLYAIRGQPTRNARQWSQALKRAIKIIESNPIHRESVRELRVVLSHFSMERLVKIMSSPSGSQSSDVITPLEILKTYSDGIHFIHDQTVRLMNAGIYTNYEIVQMVTDLYPDKFKKFLPLREIYGTIEWSVKGIIDSYVGWFDGRVQNLKEYSDKSGRIVEMVDGGCPRLKSLAEKAIEGPAADLENEQALLYALDLISLCQDHGQAYQEIYRKISAHLANLQHNSLARNYYLFNAFEIDGRLPEALKKQAIANPDGTSLRSIFRTLTTLFRPGYPHEKYWARFIVDSTRQEETGPQVHNLLFSDFCYHSFEGDLSDSMFTAKQLGGQTRANFTLAIGETDLRSFLANPGMTILSKMFGSGSGIEIVGDKLEFLKFLSFVDKN